MIHINVVYSPSPDYSKYTPVMRLRISFLETVTRKYLPVTSPVFQMNGFGKWEYLQ